MKVAEFNLNKEVGRFIRLVHDPSYLICNSNDDLVCEIPTNLLVKFFNSVFLRSNIIHYPPTTPSSSSSSSSSLSKNKAISWPPKYCTNYQLGFDHLPTTNEDKLVCRLNMKKHDNDDTGTMYCTFEVLTLRGCQGNNNRWGMIDELVLPYQLIMDNNSVYVNDFRWIGSNSILPGVGSDKFRAIQLQTSVIDVIGYDSLVVSEILTRLPVKSLFRFKSVSKHWCSTIQHDKHFIHSHFTLSKTRSPTRILIVVPAPSETNSYAQLGYDIDTCPEQEYDDDCFEYDDETVELWPYEEYHVTADLLFEGESRTKVVVDTVRKIDSSGYNSVTKPVNGLICLIDSQGYYVVRIYNLSTREISPRFGSSLLDEKVIVNGVPTHRLHDTALLDFKYEFGFDPVTNEHKVLCVWKICTSDFQEPRSTICEVLTFRGCQGNNNTSWRRINEIPPCDLLGDSVYVNGVIYFSTVYLTCAKFEIEWRPICLVAFDVGSEKFRAIALPDFILDQCPDNCGCLPPFNIRPYYSNNYQQVQLLEVDGCLAMLIRIKDCVFNMYIYEDDYKEVSTDSSSSSNSSRNNGRWSQMSSITLPWNLGADDWVYFHTFVGSDDKIILTHYERWNGEEKNCVYFYCYNWKTGTWTEFDVNGSIPSSIPHIPSGSFFTTFSENLLPLNNHNALSLSS